MLYSTFIREVNKGAMDAIAAYDNAPERQGCQIYMKRSSQTIFVPSGLITSYRTELVTFLQTQILKGLPDAAHLIVVLRDGALKLQNE
ncbi:MAG: hypothetical protein WBF88_07555 [Pusillimonas sp.]